MKQLSLIILFSFIYSSLSTAGNQDSSLLAFFPFNGNANDHSQYANDGELSGDIKLTTDRFGHPNSAYLFNGEDTHIKVSPTNYPQSSENFTLSFWIKHKNFIPLKVEQNAVGYSDMQYIIDLHSEGPNITDSSFTDGPLLVLINFQTGLSKLRQYIFKNDTIDGAHIPYREDQQFYPDSTQWYHIVFKKQGRGVTTYLNNRIVDNTYMSKNTTLNLNNYWYIGNCGASIDSDYHPEWNFAFNGTIDDVKLYSEALNEQEITTLFEEDNINEVLEGNENYKDIDSTVLAYYPFNGNANDHSLFANDGELNGDIKLTTDRFGYPNSAYLFNGKDTYIQINPENYPDSINDFTLCYWFKSEGSIPGKVYHSKNELSDFQYMIDFHSEDITSPSDFYTDGPLSALAYYQNNSSEFNSSICKDSTELLYTYPYYSSENYIADTSQWTYAVLMKEDKTISLYLNDILFNKDSINNNFSLSLNHNWFIGTSGGGINRDYHPEWNFTFNGSIDDVKLYSRALDDNEISNLYAESKCYEVYYDTVEVTVYDTIQVFDTTLVEVIKEVAVSDTLIISLTASLENNRLVNLKVYPNPTNDFIYIDTDDFSLVEDNTITIYNASGLTVYSSKIDKKSLKINISNLGSQGLYFILIMDKDLNTVSKKKILLK